MKLTIYKNSQLVTELSLQEGVIYTAGRQEDCHIVLEKLPGISRQHFEIDEDGIGHWRVNVLSEVMPIVYEKEEYSDLTLKGSGEFFLKPYRFVYESEGAEENSDHRDREDFAEDTDELQFSDIEIFKGDDVASVKDEPVENFDGNDEKTSIQGFNGLPYVKILGQNGKRSEYFRLEGNLWIVGGSQNASIFINEVKAAENHFEISKTERGFFVIDSGTSQGTELNGQRLAPKKASRLLSGDILTVGETSIQFELRDKAFKRKVSNIPLNMYKNPLVFFDQEVALVSLDDEELEAGKVEEVSQDIFSDKAKKKKFVLIAVAILMIGLVGAKEFMNSADKTSASKAATADPFHQLSPAEQKIVVQTHKLAKQLYLNGDFELALAQLEKLHSILPSYKDSKEMEEYCINSRELKRQQAAIEQQRMEQEVLANQVRSLLAQCNQQYANSDDEDGVKACLAPATDLDPSNPGIAQLISEVVARGDEKRIRQKIAQEQADKIRRGRELHEKALRLHKQRLYLDAMHAYENHIHSGLPDPANLVKKSKRKLATVEWKIKSDKTKLMSSAQTKQSGSHLKDAIKLALKAQQVDPYDPKISSFLHQATKELENKMQAIYMDSVIEEHFGNLDGSRLKWEEIVNKDIESGEYYKKARRKLKQYGYQY